ncbi:hypothetical protein [Streptomyces collinus]|uniref:hypothetical protein n=1 Tax=Streptomyces collinus TaxID=42684 RepID=UPI00362C42AB
MRLGPELANVGADVLVARRDPGEWHRVRKEFALWFERNGAVAYVTELCVDPWPGAALSEMEEKVWLTRVRMTLDHAPDRRAAARQLQQLITRFSLSAAPLESALPSRPEWVLDPGPAPAAAPASAPGSGPEGDPRAPQGTDHVDFRQGQFHGPVVGVLNAFGLEPGPARSSPADWCTAADLEPLAHGVRPAPRVEGLPALPPYVERDADGVLRSALTEGGLVVVHGEAFAGKTRTALAALAAVLPRARVHAPARHADLRGLPDLLRGGTDGCVLWLDDLDGHLGRYGLEPRLLARLTGLGAVVVATLREDAYDEHRQTSRGRVLDLARFVELPREWSGAERERAAGSRDPRLARAARRGGPEGVAAELGLAPMLWEEWWRARRPDRQPRGHALVRTAVDLARCGLSGPLPEDLIVELHTGHGAPAGPDQADVAAAWEWAGAERQGMLPLLRRHGPRRWEAVPCLVDMAERDGALPPVADALWRRALEVAREEEAYDVERVAALARTAFARAAEGGDAAAMVRLGELEESLGRGPAAEDWFRRAAGAGVGEAAGRLGRLLAARGAAKEAEPFLEAAAEAGDGGAATLLGKLLRERARKWLKVGADRADPEAEHLLAELLITGDDPDQVWDLLEGASTRGRAEIARSFGMWLLVRGQRLSGAIWLRRAADAGDGPAAELLAYTTIQEPPEDALDYFTPGLGFPLDHAHFGALLEDAGRADEAVEHYRDGYRAGDSYGAYRLAALLEKRGEADEAGAWYRRAADMGHPGARKALGESPGGPDTVGE